jgi:hypothetical protein
MAWNRHAIAQTQVRKARRVDGVGRPKFDFDTDHDRRQQQSVEAEEDIREAHLGRMVVVPLVLVSDLR